MKKLFAVLGGLAAAAAVIPFGHRKDEHSGEETFHALIWNAHISPNHKDGGKNVSINLGLTNPFAYTEEFTHYDDEALISTPDPEDTVSPEDPSDHTVHF